MKTPVPLVIFAGRTNGGDRVRQLLFQDGCEPFKFAETRTGRDGIRMVREMAHSVSGCLLLTPDLPDLSIDEVLEDLCSGQGAPPYPVIVVNGADNEFAGTMLRAGAQDYLDLSGIEPRDLIRAIERAVERSTFLFERHRVQQALHESEQKLRAIYDGTTEFVGLLTPAGILLEANRASLEFIGCRSEDVIGRLFWETPWFQYTPGAPEVMQAAVQRAATGEFVRMEMSICTPKGDWRSFDVSLQPSRDASGKVVLIVPEGMDITDRKRRETCLAFVGATTKALSKLATVDEILRVVCRRLAEHLNLARCLALEFDPSKTDASVLWVHSAPTSPPLPSILRPGNFHSRAEMESMAAGDALVYHDVAQQAVTPEAATHFERLGVRSMVNACSASSGAWKLVLSAQRSEPSQWHPEEVAMLADLTERICLNLERARAEECERARRAEVEAIMDAIPAAVFIAHDVKGENMTGNRATTEILRVPPGHNPSKSAPPEQRPNFEVFRDGQRLNADELPMQQSLKTGHPVSNQELDVVFPNGDTVNLFGNAIPLFNDAGAVRGCIGAYVDVTERRKAEGALIESRERLLRAQRAAQIGLWEWDLLTGVGSWTDEAWAAFGRKPDEFVVSYDTWMQCIHPDDKAPAAAAVEAARLTGRYRHDYRVLDPDGGVRWVESRGTFVFNPSGQPVRMQGTILDITERKRIEVELAESGRRKDEFLAMLGHELRNPLSALCHAVQIVNECQSDDESWRWARDVMARQSRQLSRLVDDLLDVARINRGGIELRREALTLHPIIDRAVAVARELINQRKHTLLLEIDRQLTVQGDPARLEQVFVNILNNAAKYTPMGGTISLRAWSENREAVVSVQDNGIGISADLLPHVFELFRQAENSLDRAEGGLGIGLSVVKSLVAMHGGRISIASPGEGAGSTVTVRLPRLENLEPSQIAKAGQTRTNEPPPGTRVLIVDDHVDAAQMLGRLLGRHGCEVRLAHSGPNGIIAAHEFLPEVLILDLGLPGFDGYELARILKAEDAFREALFIAVSGYAQEADREQSFAAGFEQHHAKPVDLAAILGGIHAWFARV